MRSRLLLAALLLITIAAPSSALTKWQGFAEYRGETVIKSLAGSTIYAPRVCPGASLTVRIAGTSTLAAIYNDTSLTVKSNPFTFNSTGFGYFFVVSGTYDFAFVGCSTTWTRSAVRIGGLDGIFNVKDYGATGDGTTDDTARIRAAAAALNSAGGGMLFFPPGNYFILPSGQTFSPLQSFASIDGIEILGYGATITVDPLRVMTTAEGTLFNFNSCSNIKIDGLRVVGPTTDMSGNVKGIEFARFFAGCENINVPNLYVEGMAAGLMFVRETPATDAIIQNIHVGNLHTVSTFYAMAGQYSPTNMVVENLRTENAHRSFFIYGAKNIRAYVHSQGSFAADCLLNAFTGYGLEDIWLTYYSDTTADKSNDGSKRVQLSWGDQTPALFRNINIHLNVNIAAAATSGGPVFLIRKFLNDNVTPDTSDRGHQLDGLTISGYMEGDPNYVGFGTFFGTDTSSTWSTGDFWYNITLRDLHIRSANVDNGPFFQLGSLVSGFRVENFYSDKYARFVQSVPDLRLPHNGRIRFSEETIFPNKSTRISAAVESMDVVSLLATGTDTVRAGWSGHMIRDSGSNVTSTLPVSVRGMEYQFQKVAAITYRIDPNGSEVIRGGGAGKYLELTPQGGAVHLYCFVAGTWDIVSSNGAFTFEP